jgi:hypothetical protein
MELQKVATASILGLIIIVILFSAFSEILPEAQDAGDSMNNTARCIAAQGVWCNTNCSGGTPANCSSSTLQAYDEVPLNGLFSSGGVVFIIVMASLLVAVVIGFFKNKK